LEKNYKLGLTTEQAVKLAINALKSYLKTKFSPDRVEIVTVDGEFKKLSADEVAKYLKA